MKTVGAPTIEIIAELAQGFEGRPEQARLLMKAVSAGGADAAKYQLVYADELAAPDYKYYELFRSLEMPDEVWEGLAAFGAELGVQLHLDIFGARSLRLAERLGVAAVKLHGTDIANVGLLREVADSSVPRVLLGAGGAYSKEIERAIDILSGKKVVVLLGFQGYPTSNEANQIARVRMLIDRFAGAVGHVTVGFADHAQPKGPLRYALAACAIGVGATVLEKHLTLGKAMKLEDHEAALNPDEFLEFTQVMRNCAEALGKAMDVEDFAMSEEEKGYRRMIRRHVVAVRNLRKGATLSPIDLVLKRTSEEEVITDLDSVYQKTLTRDIPQGRPISPADVC